MRHYGMVKGSFRELYAGGMRDLLPTYFSIIALYTAGVSTRNIARLLEGVCGAFYSPRSISRLRVMEKLLYLVLRELTKQKEARRLRGFAEVGMESYHEAQTH